MRSKEATVRVGADVVATVICALGALFTLANVHTPLRPGITVAALVLGTGWAATRWIKLSDAAFAATIAVATGLSIFCLYALLFVEIGWWHPVGSVGALLIAAAGINGICLAWDVFRGVRA